MDLIDRKLLKLLQKNSDLPLSEISGRIGISTTPCWNRIKKLEERGRVDGSLEILQKITNTKEYMVRPDKWWLGGNVSVIKKYK